jgi:hypothetical protein
MPGEKKAIFNPLYSKYSILVSIVIFIFGDEQELLFLDSPNLTTWGPPLVLYIFMTLLQTAPSFGIYTGDQRPCQT